MDPYLLVGIIGLSVLFAAFLVAVVDQIAKIAQSEEE